MYVYCTSLLPLAFLWFSIFISQFGFLVGLSQWPNSPVILSFTRLKTLCIPDCICLLSLPPTGCITPKLTVNVFLITCFYWKPWFPVLPPRLLVWPDWALTSIHRAAMPAPPTAQQCHYHAGYGLWQTTVTLGMTWTRLSDLCVWPALPWQQLAIPSNSLHQGNVECGCQARSAIQKNFNMYSIGRVCLGYILGHPLLIDGYSHKASFPW